MATRIPPPPHFPPGARQSGPPPGGRGQGAPPPTNMRGPPPGQQPFPFPIRQPVVSTRLVDLTRILPLDEDACRKKLTSYAAYTIRKVLPPGHKKDTAKKEKNKKDKDSKDKSTWAKSEHTQESWTQEVIMKEIKKLNEDGHSVTTKKQKLRNFQQNQVNQVLDVLKSSENENSDFEWSLAQIDQRFQPLGKQKETTVITVYAKRAPRSDISALGLYNFIERCKAERMAMANRPPPMPLPVEPARVSPKPKHRKSKRYHDDSSSYTGSASDAESDSDYSSSENTSISTRSGRHSRRYSHKGRRSRSRSHSRRREHRRIPYIVDSGPARPYVPEVPRAVAPAVDEINAVFEAGKHAGKIAADAERFAAADRLASPRGRAIVSNGHYEPRYPLESRYSDDRYGDDFRLRDEEQLRREDWARRRDAENYMERRAHEHTRLVPSHPFAPRRYPPSVDSGW